ncbi:MULTISPECIES: DUF883 family protein [unclassified Janthinobacterium]|uniref:DUF883 family protein n=1 Tax=unclassified Janthinobacterium TaxID=2610881 RepID=UPI0003497DA8|nr:MULTISPECIES: DUF883 family protein [unclassified Janthinobacterium]MEC5160933.1 ElaB/YqjD/DUF883 family membrane-anchored ribosome-binding protein [Janthinobacterium sp. CG_S6]
MNSTQTSNGGDSGADLNAHAGAGDAREKLMSDMKNVIHDAEDWLGKTGTRSGEEINAVKERFEHTLQTAKTDLMKLEASMMAKAKLAAQATDTYVNDNPWKSVGVGAAVGILFGLLVARR